MTTEATAQDKQAEQDRRRTIVTTICEQLSPQGFNGLRAMVGMYNWFWNSEPGKGEGLSFAFKGSTSYNHVKILLNGLDYYDVTFSKIRARRVQLTAGYENVDCEQLRGIFEDTTGLRTGL